MIEAKGIVKNYGNLRVLKGVDILIKKGEVVAITGKSGAGKSTLLNMINGVDGFTSGEVIVNSGGERISVHTLSEDEKAAWRGKTMGVVYQSFQLLPMLTLVENITLSMDLAENFKPRESRERAMELLRLVEIEEHADKLPAFISGGQQQRVAIARALANDPDILVADEPTGSLDSLTADHIFDVFSRLANERGKTIIMVTHDVSLKSRFTRCLTLVDGELQDEVPADAKPKRSRKQ